jgi:hypothetical protein
MQIIIISYVFSQSTNYISQIDKGSLALTPPASRCSTPVDARAASKRKMLPGETNETAKLSTAELQRVVLLEQLKYLRMKIRRVEREEQQSTEPAVPSTVFTDMDNWK